MPCHKIDGNYFPKYSMKTKSVHSDLGYDMKIINLAYILQRL